MLKGQYCYILTYWSCFHLAEHFVMGKKTFMFVTGWSNVDPWPEQANILLFLRDVLSADANLGGFYYGLTFGHIMRIYVWPVACYRHVVGCKLIVSLGENVL